MSMLINSTTRVIVQGMTGREGQFHTKRMQAAGTHIVGGVTPGKGGQTVEEIPVLDMTATMLVVREHGVRLIGPNCPGICTPGHGKIGIIPYEIFLPGPVGIISRSGTLTYEIVALLTEIGIGQSTCIGIGGDPSIGSTFMEYLALFERDPQTRAVVMCGEIGGSDEEDAAEYIKTMSKPVVAFVSGRTAP